METTTKSSAGSIIAVLLVAAALIGGIYYLATQKAEQPSPTSTGTPPASTKPTPVSGEPVAKTNPASTISQSTALLNGEVNPNGAQTSFWYEYGLNETLGSRTVIQLLGSGYVTLSAPAVVTGLQPSTTYYFRVGAQNRNGVSYGNILTFNTTTSVAPKIGNPPTTQTTSATNIAETRAVINGVINPRGYQTYYWFEYGKAPSLGNVTSVISAGSGTGNVGVSAPLSNLESNTTYYYRLNAQNVWGTVNGTILAFTTSMSPPPPAPQGKSPSIETDIAGFVTKNGATLNGKVNPQGSQTTYWFEYGKASLPGSFTLDSKTSVKSVGAGTLSVSTPIAVSGLDINSTYYYRVVAENQYGKSFGAILSFTTLKAGQ